MLNNIKGKLFNPAFTTRTLGDKKDSKQQQQGPTLKAQLAADTFVSFGKGTKEAKVIVNTVIDDIVKTADNMFTKGKKTGNSLKHEIGTGPEQVPQKNRFDAGACGTKCWGCGYFPG